MKQHIFRRYSAAILVLIGIYSCQKDFLDINPTDQVPAEITWQDGALAEAFVTGIYNQYLGVGGFTEEMLASFSDEAVFTHTGRNINTVNEGSASPSATGSVPASYQWQNLYNGIRAANITLEKLANPQIDTALANRLKGEAHF